MKRAAEVDDLQNLGFRGNFNRSGCETLRAFDRNHIDGLDTPENLSLSEPFMEQEKRPFLQYTWLHLTALAQAHEDDIGKLQSILAELKYRKTKKAKQVYETVVEKINELQKMPFRWPSTAVVADSKKALSGNFFEWEDGLLKFMGYAVGQNGCYRTRRREILDYIFHGSLPQVHSKKHMEEWGANRSSARLKKLANCIASFARTAKRRRNASMELAIAEWEEDLAYLKEKYYRPADGYRWPDTLLD